ncbi:hypothetical protein NPIL_106851 [Nephila pilipes]|uniref:Small integral membrane protein 15 n=1 Tax=Nephila pilipes TaxID=299642 RepID=A0A8X6TX16_NEPPI|nr:hypothetical protein NPIL_106851 [Nephila pilipes]
MRSLLQINSEIMSTWKDWVDEMLKWAAENPWEFIYYVLLALSPFFLASTILSWRLAKHIEAEERRKNKKSKKNANIAEIRRGKSDGH